MATALARKFAHAVRSHRAVENSLHWVLDMAFDEDQSRVRTGNAAENMAMLRHGTLNLLKGDTTTRKVGIAARRKKAGWSGDFMLHLLGFKTAYEPDKKRRQSRANG